MTVQELIDKLNEVPADRRGDAVRVEVIEDGIYGMMANSYDIDQVQAEQPDLHVITLEF